MTIKFIRVFFLMLSAISGYYLLPLLPGLALTEGTAKMAGLVVGFGFGLVIMVIEANLKRVSLRNLSVAAFGLAFGFFMAWMVSLILRLIPMDEIIFHVLQIVFTLTFCYLGMIISLKGKDEFNIIVPYVRFTREDQKDQLVLLDTSVIIDGRIAGVCEPGFLEGRLLVPRFVLQELQQIADSSDDSKRSRGRRGLDILEQLRGMKGVEVIIHDEGLPDIREVDAKLVRLAKMLGCFIMTTDFNLNKVAKLEGVKVLNVNDLAGSLRPVVFSGEEISVQIKKEGKEKNQGIAFMDDGTMIVIDNARRSIGKFVKVSITSILQTSAGRMIFASLIDPPEQNNDQKQPHTQQRRRSGPNRRPRPESRDRNPEHKSTSTPEQQVTRAPEQQNTSAPEQQNTSAPEQQNTSAPESNEQHKHEGGEQSNQGGGENTNS